MSENQANEPESLRLDQFLKLRGIADTGGQAKLLIQSGEVKVNSEVETRRRRKLRPGDVVEIGGAPFLTDEFFTELKSHFPPNEFGEEDQQGT